VSAAFAVTMRALLARWCYAGGLSRSCRLAVPDVRGARSVTRLRSGMAFPLEFMMMMDDDMMGGGRSAGGGRPKVGAGGASQKKKKPTFGKKKSFQ
jgi:hypothetical protein